MLTGRTKTWVALASMLACLALAEGGLRWSGLAERLEGEDMFASRLGHFEALAIDPDVVVLGNSRVRHGIDTGLLDRQLSAALGREVTSWNFGMGGVTGHSLLPLARRVLDRDHPPEVVVMGISPTDFVSTTPAALEQLVLARPWRPGDVPAAFSAGASPEQALTVLANSLSTGLSFRPRIQELIRGGRPLGPALGPDRSGYKAETPVQRALQQTRARNRAGGYRQELVGRQKRIGAFKMGCLEQALDELRAAEVRVLVVAMPASSAVNALATEPHSLVPDILAQVAAVAEGHAAGFVDWSRPGWLTDAHFTDGDHLNRDGAALLTQRLISDWILPEAYGTTATRTAE